MTKGYTLNNNLKVFLKDKQGTELKTWLEDHKGDLENHRIFYILRANLEKGDVYKIGISERGGTSAYGRLNDYYNHMGESSSDNKCMGVNLHLVVGNLFDPSVGNNKVRNIETKLIAELKKRGATERGRERFRVSIETIFKVLDELKLLKGDEETGNLKRSARILKQNQASKDTVKSIVGHKLDRKKKLKFEVIFHDYLKYDKNQVAKPTEQTKQNLTYEQLIQMRDGKKKVDEYIITHNLK